MRYIIMRIFNILTISLCLIFTASEANSEIIDKVLAQVGPRIITLYDVESYSPARVKAIYETRAKELRDVEWNRYYKEALDQLIYINILEIAAERHNITVTEQEVNDMMVSVAAQHAQFRAALQTIIDREGFITPEATMFTKAQVLKEKLVPVVASRAVYTDSDINAFLEKSYGIAMDSINYNIATATFSLEDDAKSFVDDYRKGSDFATLAEEHGGKAAAPIWVYEAEVIPELGSKLKSLRKDTVSEPIATTYGTYIVMTLIDSKKGAEVPEAELANAENSLFRQYVDAAFVNWFERNKASIIVTHME